MRTTLAIDDDVLAVAKSLAQQQHQPVGVVISNLVRQALRRDAPPTDSRNGIPLLPARSRATAVTMEAINALRDEGA